MIYLTQGILLGLYAALTPGPFQTFLFSQSLRVGWRRTLQAAIAPLLSDGPIVAFFLFILSEAPLWLINSLRFFGGFFLIFLAWEAYHSAGKANQTTASPPLTADISLLKAVLMNFFNPNVYIFWGTIGAPIVLAGWQQSSIAGWSFLIGFYCTIIPAFALLITLFGATNRLNKHKQRQINLFLAFVLLAFGLYRIWQGFLVLTA